MKKITTKLTINNSVTSLLVCIKEKDYIDYYIYEQEFENELELTKFERVYPNGEKVQIEEFINNVLIGTRVKTIKLEDNKDVKIQYSRCIGYRKGIVTDYIKEVLLDDKKSKYDELDEGKIRFQDSSFDSIKSFLKDKTKDYIEIDNDTFKTFLVMQKPLRKVKKSFKKEMKMFYK